MEMRIANGNKVRGLLNKIIRSKEIARSKFIQQKKNDAKDMQKEHD